MWNTDIQWEWRERKGDVECDIEEIVSDKEDPVHRLETPVPFPEQKPSYCY